MTKIIVLMKMSVKYFDFLRKKYHKINKYPFF